MNDRRKLAAAAVVLLILLIGVIWWLSNPQPRARTLRVATAPASTRPQVLIETRFLYSSALETLLENSGERWLPREGAAERWPRFLNDRERDNLLFEASKDKMTSIVSAPRLTLESGQGSYVKVTRQTAYLSDIKVVTKNGKPTTQPVIALAESGMTVECQATPSANGKSVTLLLKPRTSNLLDLTTRPWKGEPAGQVIQVAHLLEWKLNATLAMPFDATVVYRLTPTRTPATTSAPTSAPATQPADRSPPALLLVRPSLVRPDGANVPQ